MSDSSKLQLSVPIHPDMYAELQRIAAEKETSTQHLIHKYSVKGLLGELVHTDPDLSLEMLRTDSREDGMFLFLEFLHRVAERRSAPIKTVLAE